MARIWSLKTCLFCLIGIVVAFTLLLITKYQSTAQTVTRWNAHPLTGKSGGDDDISAYYTSNAEHHPRQPQVALNNNKKNINKYETRVAQLKNENNNDYPFEEDFVNQDSNNNENSVLDKKLKGNVSNKRKSLARKGEEDGKEDADAYAGANGYYSGKDEDKKAIGGGNNNVNNNKKKKLPSSVTDITCDVNNGKFMLECKKEENEVYVPFSFIQKYFEVFGKMSEKDENKFIWLHSNNPKIYRPKSVYDPKGVFTYFENYNVEVRDRVKCVSGAEGVPISTQWERKGYFYPIQIAQFGLAHYSKYMTEGEPERVILENGDSVRGKWTVNAKSDLVVVPEPLHAYNHIVQVQHTSVAQPVTMMIDNSKPRLLVLSFDLKTDTSSSLTEDAINNHNVNVSLTATLRYENQQFVLHYLTADFLIYVQENHIYHGLGKKSFSKWQHVIRDLGVDVQKGVSQSATPRKGHKATKIMKSKLVLESISFSVPVPASKEMPAVKVYLDNITLSTNEHLAQFFQSADWFVKTQDERGGWPIPVRRKFASDFYPVLQPGWYSGMGQGHALSLLSRAYALTRKPEYASACGKAVHEIFDLPGSQHGVKAVFLDKYTWYEEYPTTPSTFVLNGFMYALLGLYDVKALEVPGAWKKALQLYDKGLISLKTMLPLYDTGSGTMYDLRHFTVTGIVPNPARLDYHVTHINQLLTFATFEEDPIFSTTAERWIGYTQGDRAPHN